MADPQTSNIGFYIPTRGSDPGAWDLPVNANSSALDAMFANVSSISLTNAPVTLSQPPNSGASWSGPYQAQSSLVKLTGAISADIVITIPRAGYYIFWNTCTDNASGAPAGALSTTDYIQLTGGAGKTIGLPPGKKCHVFFDGTDMDFVNMPDPGTAYDLHGVTALPSWMSACSVLPYLIKDGSTYLNTAYPTLSGILGTTFGGTPSLSFAVPDERNRMRVPLDTNPGSGFSNRITVAGAGFNGQTMAANGGEQTHTLVLAEAPKAQTTLNNGAHTHGISANNTAGTAGAAGVQLVSVTNTTLNTNNTTLSLTDHAGGGAHNNVQPAIVSFLALIKTAILIGALAAASNMLPRHAAAHEINRAIATSEVTSQ